MPLKVGLCVSNLSRPSEFSQLVGNVVEGGRLLDCYLVRVDLGTQSGI